ncbi:patched domain-containing protein 3-like [Hyperolius riggenbachi]|uniref:patched domain-containing protein 3-like n=1 Tax=Hyperolius riggenbachi TaxID=752182 RepID=UPI0035A2AF48
MAPCRTDCIQRPLSAAFSKLGKVVARYPWWFLTVPLVVTAGFGAGFYFLDQRQASNIEEKFTPAGGPAKSERKFVVEHFPTNDSTEFSPQRLYTEGLYVSLIAVSASDNILDVDSFRELVQVDEMVQNLSIKVTEHGAGAFVTFQQLCAKVRSGKCFEVNPLLTEVRENLSLIETINITYPMFQGRTFLGVYLGGLTMNPDSTVQKAKAIRFMYYLREDNSKDKDNSLQWIGHFLKSISENLENLQLRKVQISYFASISRQEELEAITNNVVPLFAITYVVTISFAIISCVRFDSVRNKVWVAAFGVITAGLAVLSSFGLLLLCGVPFVITVAAAPFLILGVGVDNMFIMLSSWQQSKVKDRVEERMAETYAEAAVSITITTLTDALAFYIGILTSFESIQSFCIYAGTAILFCFLFNITCFGAFLALNGRREESNRHWFICKRMPEEEDDSRSSFYNRCCVGGRYSKVTGKEVEHPIPNFFNKKYGPFLTNIWTKILVLILYGGYLGGSIYGCLQVQEGIDLRNMATDSSYVRSFYDDEDLYLSEYGPMVMVGVTEEIPYWDSEVRDKFDRCLESFQSSSYVSKEISDSWLKVYLRLAELLKLDISDKNYFMGNLSILFTLFPDYKQDVNIRSGVITASRFFIQTVNVTTGVDEKNLLNEVRNRAKSCEIPVLVYHVIFIYFDQYTVIIPNTVQNIAAAAAVMFLISLLLIPNPLCSLWVTFTVASIIVGVTGFMAYWKVNLDAISMIILIICIGFSVDFSAHISYAFVSNKKLTVNEKVTDALHSLGYPILQGGASTILGVVALSTADSYIFRTFFKIIFLVIVFGVLHGLVFLPVFLALFGNCGRKADDVAKRNGSTIDVSAGVPQCANEISLDESNVELRTTNLYSNKAFSLDSDKL